MIARLLRRPVGATVLSVVLVLALASCASGQLRAPRNQGTRSRLDAPAPGILRPLADYRESALVTLYVHPGNVRAEVYRGDELVATPEPRGANRSAFMVRFFDIQPDGETVAFLISRPGYRYARVLVPIQRDSLRVLGVMLASEYEADRILYATPGLGGTAIGAALPDGSEARVLVDTPDLDAQPSVAPDGYRVAFASGEEGARRILVLDRRSGAVTPVLSSAGSDYSHPGWLDDRTLVVLRATGDHQDLEVHDLESGARRVMPHAGGLRTPRPHPDGERVLFSTDAYDAGWDIAEWEPATNAVRRLTALPGDERGPSAHPIDGRIAYVRDLGDGSPPFVAMTSDLPGVGRTADVARYGALETVFSADGAVLLALDPQGVAAHPEGTSWWGRPISGDIAVGSLAWGRLARLDSDPALVVFETDTGASLVRVEADSQPIAAARFLGLLDAGLYSNTVVHRVAPGMTVQMGCPRGNGTGGMGPPAPWEPSALSLTRGRVAMEPEGDGLASSRFLVALDDLTGNGFPGAFATVLEGMEVWDRALPGDRVRRAYRLRFDEDDFRAP
ncbi:MAG: hypothetical protein GX134_11010 [candidate division WS1 bacterium]|jgi:cyclophilin family peptidyl-prolyl cis-trans isomerase|nr:hypothetical protein [candidate division WS1 bacterium]